MTTDRQPGSLVESLRQSTSPDPRGRPAAAGRSRVVHELTSALVRGDARAFERFHELFFPRLYGYLLRLAHGQEDLARDAIQEALLRVLRHIKPFVSEGNLWRWLQRVARTALIDLVRREARWRRVVPLSDDEAGGGDPVDVAGAGGCAGAMAAELEAGLARLDGGERDLIERQYFKGQGHEQIGSALGISSRAVESRLGRIRKKLRRYLIEELER